MLSSLVFHHTLRDSRGLLEGIAYSNDKRVFVTADSAALRLWSCTRQIKASHFMTGGFELLALEYLDYVDCFLLIYYLRESEVGYAELWDTGLNRIQRIKMGTMTSKSKCALNPDRTFFIMSDNEEDLHCFNIIAAKKFKPKQGPWFPRASDVSRTKPQSTAASGSAFIPRVQIRKVQTIPKSSLAFSKIQAIHVFNDNCFAIIASSVLYLFKRRKGKEPFKVDVEELTGKELVKLSSLSDHDTLSRGVSSRGSQFNELTGDGDGEGEEEQEQGEAGEEEEEGGGREGAELISPEDFPEDYNFVLLKKFDEMFQSYGIPVSIEVMGATKTLLCTAFTSGYIGVYECRDLFSPTCGPAAQVDHNDSYDGDEVDLTPPSPVVFFKAHSPLASSPFVSTQLRQCPWQTVPGDVYAIEFFSLGSDYKLNHWGLRRRLDGESAADGDDLSAGAGAGPGASPGAGAALDLPIDMPLLTNEKSAKTVTYEVDLMGSFRFPQDSVEIRTLSSLAGKRRRRPIRLQISPFDIQAEATSTSTSTSATVDKFFDHSSRRALCITVGGSLGFFLLQQPLRVVVPHFNPTRQGISCSRGVLVSVEMISTVHNADASMGDGDVSTAVSNSSLSQNLNQKMTDELMFVLADGTVQGFALRSGVLMFQMSVRRIPINLNKVGDTDHVYKSLSLQSSLRFKSLKGSIVDLKQGDPCCVHYCQGTGHLAVGYSDGAVSLLTIHHADIEAYKHGSSLDISPSSNIPILTADTHHTPITKMANISFTSMETTDAVEHVVIGDEYGLLSIWTAKHRHQLVASAEVTRKYVGHCHKKAISHIEVIYLDHSMSHQTVPTREPVKNHCVLITTCLSGDIKAWSLSSELGVITLVGSLSSNKKIMALGVTLLPFIDTSDDDHFFGDTGDDSVTLGGGGGDNSTAQAPPIANSPSAHASDNREEFNIICATGHNDGTLCSWIFSSNLKNARKGPTSVVHAHASAVVGIVSLPEARNKEAYFKQEMARLMLSACCNGSSCLFGISKSGLLVPLHLYFSPGPTRSIAVCQGALVKTPSAEVEIVQINESNMTSFIAMTAPFNSSVIPVRWRQDTKPKLVDDLHVPIPETHMIRSDSLSSQNSLDDSLCVSEITKALESGQHQRRKISKVDLCVGSVVQPPSVVGERARPVHSGESLASSDVGGAHSEGNRSSGSRGLSLQNLRATSARKKWIRGGDSVSDSSDVMDDDDLDMPSPPKEKSHVDNWTDTLGIRTELFLAKKDGYLIELFRQRATKDDMLIDVIRARDAAEILDQWVSKNIDDDINGQGISKNQVLEIFKFLGISPRDMIDYIKVAKIASVLKTMNKSIGMNEPFDQPLAVRKNRLNKKFKSMKTVTTLVTYNAMGERVIQKIPLVEKTHNGIPDGYGDEIRHIWSLEPPRVLFHVNAGRNQANDSETIMKRIPLHIVGRLYGKIKIGKRWKSTMEHWFDLRRTVRVARTIFDMRFVAQQDFLVKHSIQRASHYELPSMTDLVLKYFERSYGKGHGDMNIAHQKVVTFLEALCQYSEYSLINSLRYFIFSEEEEFELGTIESLNYKTSTTYAWLYTEAREWVKTNSMFLNGGEVQNDNQTAVSTLHAGGVYLEAQSVASLGTTSNLGAGQVKSINVQWLLIRRSDALLCVQEMLRTRGCYGPAIIENMVYMVDSVLPATTPVSALDRDEDYEYSQPVRDHVDFEQFLEVLVFEMKKHDQEIGRVRDKLFSTKSLPDNYLHATASLQGLMSHDNKQENMLDNEVGGEFVSVQVFQSTQDMMQMFIGLDPTRSGFIPTKHFCRALKKVLAVPPHDPLLSPVNSSAMMTADLAYRDEDKKDVLVNECVTRFGDVNGLDTVGYVDFVAIVLAYVFLCPQRMESVNSEWMMTAIKETRRSLDRAKGMVLLTYLSLAQGYRQQHDPYWMAHPDVKMNDGDHEVGLPTELINGIETLLRPGTAGDPLGVEAKHSGKISYQGQWSQDLVAPASDGPGTLSIKKIIPSYVNGASEVGLVCDGVVSRSSMQKTSDSNLYIVPVVMSTNRTQRTLHGEVFISKTRTGDIAQATQPPVIKPDKRAYITQFDVGEEGLMSLPFSNVRKSATDSNSSRFPTTGSQIIEGYRFENSTSLLRDDDVPITASTMLTLTLPSESNQGSTAVQSPRRKDSSKSNLTLPSDRTPMSTHRLSQDSAGNSQMDIPQEYIDLQNRSFILSEIDEMKASKKFRVDEEQRNKRMRTLRDIEERRSMRGSFGGSIVSDDGSFDHTLEEGSGEENSLQSGDESVGDIINLFSKVSQVYPEGYIDKCVDESTRQLYELRDLEQQMAKELDDSALYQQLKMHQKYLKIKQEKREMRKKEKASLVLMGEQDEERFKRLEAGRNMQKQRDMEEEEEKKAAELAEKQKVNQRRIDREHADNVKKEKAAKEAEVYRELQELLAMRKVEKFSIAAEEHAKEVAEAARLKQLAEEEARAAKEAQQRRARMEREQKEADRVAKEAERKRKEEENEARFSEMLHMQKEDWDVGKPERETNVEEEEGVEENSGDQEEDDDEDDEDEDDEDEEDGDGDYDMVPTKGKINDAKLRLVELIHNLKVARRGNGQHPRAKSKENFFQPMLFNNDIEFNPFVVPNEMHGDYSLMPMGDGDEDPESGFDDITREIKEFKRKQHKDNMQRLYQFNNDNIPLSQWTTLVLKEAIDWEEFFDDDYEKAFPGSERVALTPAEKKKQLQRKREKAQRKKSLIVSQQLEDDVMVVMGNVESQMEEEDSSDEAGGTPGFGTGTGTGTGFGTDSFSGTGTGLGTDTGAGAGMYTGTGTGSGTGAGAGMFPEPRVIIPLPLGKVIRKDIQRGRDHYFQIELSDLSSILTIELNSSAVGDNDCFDVDMSTKGYFPANGKAEVTAAKYNASNQHVIVYNPANRASEVDFIKMSTQDIRKTTTLIVGVHHKHSSRLKSAPYEIWAMTTTSAPASETLENVSKTVKILDTISGANEEDLWRNMPKIHRDAHKKAYASRPSTIPIIMSPDMQSQERNRMDDKVDSDEMEGFENFITKAGRSKLRENLTSLHTSSFDSSLAESQFTRLDAPVDPNMHEDLFLPPHIVSLDEELDRSFSQSMKWSRVCSDEGSPPTSDCDSRSFPALGSRGISVDRDDRELRQSEDFNNNPNNNNNNMMMMRKSETLPQLDNKHRMFTSESHGLNDLNSFYLDHSKSSELPLHLPVTHSKFPYISKTKIRSDDLNPKPKYRKIREFPDPKPAKYTTRK